MVKNLSSRYVLPKLFNYYSYLRIIKLIIVLADTSLALPAILAISSVSAPHYPIAVVTEVVDREYS